jgi:A/G-specific adenine glycosylase
MEALNARALRTRLLTWYDAEKRDLPWRRTRDPYAIWVSEVMLQQTQVARVVGYWRRFIEAYPTVSALASAPLDDVLALWSGLGYYQRARRLHEAARVVVEERGGALPESAARLRELPGMGEYTSAAVASIALGEAVPVLDTNVVRVLSRLAGFAGDAGRSGARRALRTTAARLVEGGRPGDVNQALMELGALVCLPSSPRCEDCPVSTLCTALASGDPESFPAASGPKRTERLRESALVVLADDSVLLTNRPHPRGWWAGLWRLPASEAGFPVPSECVGDAHDTTPDRAGHVDYTVTNHRVALDVSVVRLDRPSCPADGFRWFQLDGLEDVAVPAPHRRALALPGVSTKTAPPGGGAVLSE